MEAAAHPDHAGGAARTLLALRHALADPLSAAALKLHLVEHRLLASASAEAPWAAERIRAVQADVTEANRLIDLLLRLAEIGAEHPAETSLRDVCKTAGLALLEGAAVPRVALRQRSAADALQGVASFLARGDGASAPLVRAGFEGSRATLDVEGTRTMPGGRPERLLELPPGIEGAEALFVARAVAEADGGRLELSESAGRLVARFSWPAEPEGA